jgi:hypothetical protein
MKEAKWITVNTSEVWAPSIGGYNHTYFIFKQIPLFLPLTTQRFAEHHPGFRQKSWNKLIEILKFREKFQISLNFFPSKWQYLSDMDCFICCVFSVLYCSVTLYYSLLLFFFCVLYCSLFVYCTVSACDVRAATLTEVFPCFFLSSKANARV